jgi:hypothetical protein
MNSLRTKIVIAAAIAVLTLLGFYQFPGHTYLQSDTQVYVPMLERSWDHIVLQQDFMVQRPHMALTIYDETAMALRRLTGLGFQEVLTAQQILFRALGLLGVFLIAGSLKLGARMSLLVTSIYALGASVGGPTVLTLEYEPIPRAFALPLLLLAIGLVAHDRYLAAGMAAAAAFLYHPTTALAFWAVYFVLACRPAGFPVMRRRLLGLAPLLVAGVFLLLSAWQAGGTESSGLFGRIAPWWEQLLRLRSSYIWVSLWFPRWYWHYAILWLVTLAACWRLWKETAGDLRFFWIGLPLAGVLSVPASYLFLEAEKLALAPQLQVARNVLFITLVAGLLSSMAGIRAAQARRRLESFVWFAAAFAIPTGDPIQWTFLANLGDPVIRRRLLLVLILAALAAVVAWAERSRYRWGIPAWAALALLPFYLYPTYGKVENYPRLLNPDLEELSRWARSSTGKEAMFLFPDAGRDLHPGIFRACALRAVYVDWKAGGQANYFPEVGQEWWKRWQELGALKYRRGSPGRYAQYGIDYVVLKKKNAARREPAVFENASFIAYRVR